MFVTAIRRVLSYFKYFKSATHLAMIRLYILIKFQGSSVFANIIPIHYGDTDEQEWLFHVVITSLLSSGPVLGPTSPQSSLEDLRSICMKHWPPVISGKELIPRKVLVKEVKFRPMQWRGFEGKAGFRTQGYLGSFTT